MKAGLDLSKFRHQSHLRTREQTRLRYYNKIHFIYMVILANLLHATFLRMSDIQPVTLKVTCDLTKVCRLISKPLASGVITSTVKWASNSRHIQSIICKFHKRETDSGMRKNQPATFSIFPELLNEWRNVCLDQKKETCIKNKALRHSICPPHWLFCLQNGDLYVRWSLHCARRGLSNQLVKTLILTWVTLGDLTSGFCGEASWQYLR